jgi:di/tricarboxylate transporter
VGAGWPVTRDQILVFMILGGMLGLFLWDRLRYDLVALLALLAAVVCGVIPANRAFDGFSNEVIALIAGALVVSAAIGRSGLVEAMIRLIAPHMRSPTAQVATLATLVALLSAFMKNIGALAIFLPIAIQLAERRRRSPSELLMPLAFASLIGGSMTLIGTSPNILISSIRRELEGAPFTMFAFTPVAAGTVLAGLVFLALGWPLIPKRRAQTSPAARFRTEHYTAEARVPKGALIIGKSITDLPAAIEDGDCAVQAVIRDRHWRYFPAPDWTVAEGDILVLESDPHVLKKVIDRVGLELVGRKPIGSGKGALNAEKTGTVEAVVTANSVMIGCSPADLSLRERYGVNLLAASRRGHKATTRLRHLKFQAGDVVALQGDLDGMPDTLARLGCLPLAPRDLQLGRPRQVVLPVVILAAATAATTTEIVPVAVAFVGAAVAVALCRVLTLREVYESIEWPILVLLGALIPVGEAVRHTGATDLIAGWLSGLAGSLPGGGVLALVMIMTMLVTPILHHAASVIVMGPIAASLAVQLGFHIDPFLIAVAIGANSDFLSPIGHQCNTLVMGPGGYRFGDYWRLGLPLSTIVVVVGVPLILFFWPLR